MLQQLEESHWPQREESSRGSEHRDRKINMKVTASDLVFFKKTQA